MPIHRAKLSLDDVSGRTIGAAIAIHRALGPGLYESVYERLLAAALRAQGLHVRRQRYITFVYHGTTFKRAFRIDLLVEHELLVEVKSVDGGRALHKKQLLTYLRLTKQPLGILLNFGCETLRDGLTRVVNELDQRDSPLLHVNSND